MKIIHCADLHLGAGGSSLGHLGVTRMAEIKNTFMNIVRLCESEEVKYLLIAGDMFDTAGPNASLVKDVAAAFASIPDTKVCISPGNHDYAASGSCYLDEHLWSENVHIFRGGWEYVEFPEDKVRVFGAAFTSMYQIMPLMDTELKYPEDDFLNIGVLHGELVRGAGESNYNPITVRQIKECGLNYLALGHIHLRSEIDKQGKTWYSYSGCHEGRGFDELGSKGIYIGDITTRECNLEYRHMARRMHFEVNADVSQANDTREVVYYIEKELKKCDDNFREHLYKISITGKIDDSIRISPEEIAAAMEVFFAKIKDRTELNVDYDAIAREENLKGMFVKKMLLMIRDYEAAGKAKEAKLYGEALDMGYKAFR